MIRRFFTRILIVMLIAFCGYNWLQVRHLQAQVDHLQAQRGKPGAILTMKPHPLEAQQSLFELQSGWKHLRNQAAALRSAGKKVLHELPI